MEFIFDPTTFILLGQKPPIEIMWILFREGGWIVFTIVMIYGAYFYWLMKQQHRWYATNKYILLAIDIPKDTEQTPKAVEQLFSTISGAHKPLSAKEIYLQGKLQLSFQFEIISIDGYIQFIIRTPTQWRDLVEAAVYSQYPDAEITEVEDYVGTAPNDYPNETHNIWATEVIPTVSDVYPIRTYKYFEDMVSGEFKDPIASLLETMSKVQKGEQVWLQFIVKPTGFDWPKRSLKEAYRIAGKKLPEEKSWLERVLGPLFGLFFISTGETMFFQHGLEAENARDKKRDELPSLMLHLTPGEKNTVQAIEEKASKNGFECKIRLIYISPNEIYHADRVVSSVFGSIKQFNTLDLNSFKPDPRTKTQIMYLFIKYRLGLRRRNIMSAYKRRSGLSGHAYFILNTEELASIWHFPSKYIKTPSLQRTESKKSEPPFSLPVATETTQKGVEVNEELRRQLNTEAFDVDLADKHFEEKFAKDKSNVGATQKGSPPPNLPTG